MDISLLPGLPAKTRESLRQGGINHLHQIVALNPDELRQFKGIKTSAPAIHAHARAFVEQRHVWYNPIPDRCRQSGIMFDLETNPFSGIPWSLGWSDGEGDVRIILVAGHTGKVNLPDEAIITPVPDYQTAWEVFAEAVSQSDAPIYHWSGFDAGILRSTGPLPVREQLQSRMCDLLAAFKGSVKLPVRSNSLKVVAAYFGFAWSGYEDWSQAWEDYQRWLRQGSADVLTHACAYQSDDVRALAITWRWMVDHAETLPMPDIRNRK